MRRKITLKVTVVLSLVLALCLLFSMIPMSITGALNSSYTVNTVLQIASEVVTAFETNGTFPSSVSSLGTFTQRDFFSLALPCIKQLYEGDSTSNITPMAAETTGNILNYQDSFNQIRISKDDYMNTVTRNINFANNGIYFASHVVYPSGGYTHLSGNFSFTRGLYTYARILNWYKNNGALPDYIDCTDYPGFIYPSATPSAMFTLTEVVNAADKAMKAYVKTGSIPSTLTVGSNSISKVSYFRLIMTTINNINAGKASMHIPYYVCTNPNMPEPADNITMPNLPKAEYLRAIRRQLIYMNNNGNRPGAMILSFLENKDLPYTSTLIMFTRVLSYYKTNNNLPEQVQHK